MIFHRFNVEIFIYLFVYMFIRDEKWLIVLSVEQNIYIDQ
jgi:hypothetical protein